MHWIIFAVEPQKEKKIAKVLEDRLGFRAWVPIQIEKTRQRGFHRVHIDKPKLAYPGNVLIGFEGAIPWAELPPLQGWLLGRLRCDMDGHPWVFSDEDLAFWRRATVEPDRPKPVFKIGEVAKLLTAGFVGCDFEVEETSGDQLIGLTQFLGAPRRMTVHPDDLEKVSA